VRVKTCVARIKAVGEQPADAVEPVDGAEAPKDTALKDGEFEAIVSAYNVDAVGDQVMEGAFSKSLAKWKDSGNPIPVIWSHDHGNPDAHIGVVEDAKEIPGQGLWVKGLIDQGEPFAQKVYNLMKSRRVTKFSFAYDMIDPVENDKGGFDLKELDLWEVGPTLIPANDQTSLLTIKNLMRNEDIDLRELAIMLRELKKAGGSPALLGSKAGRVLSAKNETTLTEALATISDGVNKIKGVLSAVSSGDDAGKEAKPAGSAEKPVEGKTAPVVEDPTPADADKPAKSNLPDDLRTKLDIDSMLAEF
jgi:HK97 family phage prohead protease